MDLGFTWFDFAALVVLGLSGVMAFARGLIREGDTLLLDGDAGTLTIRPAQCVVDAFEGRRNPPE